MVEPFISELRREAGDLQPLKDYLNELVRQRNELTLEIKRVRTRLGLSASESRPMWHCRRCGNDWLGHSIERVPRHCARCHSSMWNEDPIYSNARKPSDPPNPRWAPSPTERLTTGASPGLPPPPRDEPAPRPLADFLHRIVPREERQPESFSRPREVPRAPELEVQPETQAAPEPERTEAPPVDEGSHLREALDILFPDPPSDPEPAAPSDPELPAVDPARGGDNMETVVPSPEETGTGGSAPQPEQSESRSLFRRPGDLRITAPDKTSPEIQYERVIVDGVPRWRNPETKELLEP